MTRKLLTNAEGIVDVGIIPIMMTLLNRELKSAEICADTGLSKKVVADRMRSLLSGGYVVYWIKGNARVYRLTKKGHDVANALDCIGMFERRDYNDARGGREDPRIIRGRRDDHNLRHDREAPREGLLV